MNNRILLIRTGGTIDSEPYEDPSNPPPIVDTLKGDQSLIMKTLATIANGDKVDGFSWGTWQEDSFVKDSQKFTQEDIQALAEIIKTDSHRYFVLTHGTDAMVKNALMLQEALNDTDKTIVLTGAMVPLSMAPRHKSDAQDTLEYTLKHIEQQPAGVHIVGRDAKTKRLTFFDPHTVEKNRTESLKNLQFTLSSR